MSTRTAFAWFFVGIASVLAYGALVLADASWWITAVPLAGVIQALYRLTRGALR